MNCESVRNSLSLLLYGELSFDDEERIEQHLDSCEPCRELFRKETAIHSAIDGEELEPQPGMLAECRRDLRAGLSHEAMAATSAARSGGRWERWIASLLPAGSILRPAGALALVAMGFFGAQLVPVDYAPFGVQRASLTDPVSSRVRYVNPATDGRVQIIVDETRQRTLSGPLEDERIQQLLLTAARESNDPGLRVETMDILKAQCERSEIRQALLYALQNDRNAGVRLKALEGLKPYAQDPETRKVLSQVLLTDENPAVRTQAIDVLVQNREQDLVPTLQELLRSEEDSYVRLRSQRVLREMKASVETF
jgi:hypothetical protein